MTHSDYYYDKDNDVYLIKEPKDNWHRVKLTGRSYLNLSDVKRIYVVLNNNSTTGIDDFAKIAKTIATITPTKNSFCYLFTDESNLFELLKDFFSDSLQKKGIDSFGKLMQYIA